jgi:serine phosphatase RsbU (regulator of sigma subunit)
MLRVVDLLPVERAQANRHLYAAFLRWAARYPDQTLRPQLRRNVQEAFRLRYAFFRALLGDALRSLKASEERIRQVVKSLDQQLYDEARQALEALERFRRELERTPSETLWSRKKQQPPPTIEQDREP